MHEQCRAAQCMNRRPVPEQKETRPLLVGRMIDGRAGKVVTVDR